MKTATSQAQAIEFSAFLKKYLRRFELERGYSLKIYNKLHLYSQLPECLFWFKEKLEEAPPAEIKVAVNAAADGRRCLYCLENFPRGRTYTLCALCNQLPEAVDYAKDRADQLRSESLAKHHADPTKHADYMRKLHKTCRQKYGVDHHNQSPEQRQKAMDTCMDRYGGPNPMSSADLVKKAALRHPSTGTFTYKGIAYKYQGFERVVIESLVDYFGEVVTQFDDSYKRIESDRIWYPDLYVPSIDTYVEVKSSRTLMIEFLKNRDKHKASITAGYKVKFVVVKSRSNEILKLPDNWSSWGYEKLFHYVEAGLR